MKIKDLLGNKTSQEQSRIKSEEIAKLNFVGEYTDPTYGVKVEIQSLNKIEINGQHGVEIMARAWKAGKQLGFGDGTVEIERFRIFNPPILIQDGTFRIELDKRGNENRVPNFIENPIKAIWQTLAHTIGCVGKENSQIIKDRIGNTTDTFFPSMDGQVTMWLWTTGWANARAQTTGAGASSSTSSIQAVDIFMGANQGERFGDNYRTFFLFDTSPIPDANDIISATFSFIGTSKITEIADSVALTMSDPASDTEIVNGDYYRTRSLVTKQATSIPISGIDVGGSTYTDFTLNPTGLGNISKTGMTRFGTKSEFDLADSPVPSTGITGSDRQVIGLVVLASETDGTSSDPKLVVVHSAPPVAVDKTFTSDGIVKIVVDKTFTSNGIVKVITDKTITSDGRVKIVPSELFDTDGIVKIIQDKNFASDGIVTTNAVIRVRQSTGAIPDNTIISNLRFSSDDVVNGTNRVGIPTSGTDFSYWKSFYLDALTSPIGTINNIKFYTDGGVFGNGVSVKGNTASAYTQATDNRELTTSSYPALAGAPVDIDDFVIGSPLVVPGSISNPSTGKISDWVVLQANVSFNAIPNAQSAEVFYFQFDET